MRVGCVRACLLACNHYYNIIFGRWTLHLYSWSLLGTVKNTYKLS